MSNGRGKTRTYTDEELIAAMCLAAERLGHPPTEIEYDKFVRSIRFEGEQLPDRSTIERRIGWAEAKRRAAAGQ
jgi:hypothetical protein